MDKDSAAGFGIGLLAGVVAGLAVGLLFAPQSGRETRQLIRDRAGNVYEKVGDVVETAKEKVGRIRGRRSAEEEIAEEA
jgi:gas vesicle protein